MVTPVSVLAAKAGAGAALLLGHCATFAEPPPPPVTTPPAVRPETTGALPARSTQPSPSPFQRFDDLSIKGFDIPFPKTADTMIRDIGGVRSALADIGVSFLGYNMASFQYDIAQTAGHYRGPQLYNGQKLTRTASFLSAFMAINLGQYGIPGGQIQVTGGFGGNTFNRVDGPDAWRIGRFAYFQPLFGDSVELKFGILDNGQEFLGTNVGGNLATGNLGPLATIPYQVGLSYGGFGAPGVNAKWKAGRYLYTKIGIQRSLRPGGANAENPYNPDGFTFRTPGTSALIIDEIGWNRPPAPGSKSLWIRGGGIYNMTHYPRFRDGRPVDNHALFLAADRQITQPDPGKPFRGLYLGATANYAPPAQNLYTQYYESRIYGLGLAKGRPFDLASLVINASLYSRAALRARLDPQAGRYHQTLSAVASYAYRLVPGLYLQPGLGVVVHPVYSPRFGTAVNGYLTITTLL